MLRNELTLNPFDHIRLERIQKKTLLQREDDYYLAEEIEAKYVHQYLLELIIKFNLEGSDYYEYVVKMLHF